MSKRGICVRKKKETSVVGKGVDDDIARRILTDAETGKGRLKKGAFEIENMAVFGCLEIGCKSLYM